MRRITVTSFAVVGAALLYVGVVSGRAQESPAPPFAIGDQVTLGYIDGSVSCLLAERRGDFVRCAPPNNRDMILFNQPKIETWFNVATVKFIDKSAR